MLLSSQKGKKSKKKPTLKGKKSSSITTSVFVPASPSPSGTPPLLNANQNSTSPDARKEGSPSGASSVRFTTSTHFHRPNSESPPPSSPVPQTLQGSPGLLRNKSFDHHDRVSLSKNKKGLFSRTKSIERVFSHQVVIEQPDSTSSLTQPSLGPAASSSTSGKKKHFVRRKSIEQLVMSTLSLRPPRTSNTTPPTHSEDSQPSTSSMSHSHSRKKSGEQATHVSKKSDDQSLN